MSEIKMAAKLPDKLDDNGLYLITKALINRPSDQHVIIAVVDCKSVTTDYHEHKQTPTAQVLSVEVITGEEEDTARRLMHRARDKRQQATALPLDYGLSPRGNGD